MAGTRLDTLARWTGLALGLGLAALAALSWRLPPGGGRLGADVRLVATPPGELETSPPGAFVSARALTPGGRAAEGTLRVRNIAGRPLEVRVRALPSGRALDRLLFAQLVAGGRVLFRGSLRGLRPWSRAALRVPVRGSRAIAARVWLRHSDRRRSDGRIEDVTVELDAHAVAR